MKMKHFAAIVALSAVMSGAHAESFFQVEAGIGAGIGQTLNDGVWYQQGNPQSNLHNVTPAYVLGVTGEAYRTGNVDLRYHVDYVYIGSQSASCMCVQDDAYDAYKNQIVNAQSPRQAFSGGGHVQGIAATLDAGYNYGPWRFGAEAGPWLFWETWHQGAQAAPGSSEWINVDHNTVAQLSWVVGGRISRGPVSLSYRYYKLPQLWNPSPALLRAVHVITLQYRFF